MTAAWATRSTFDARSSRPRTYMYRSYARETRYNVTPHVPHHMALMSTFSMYGVCVCVRSRDHPSPQKKKGKSTKGAKPKKNQGWRRIVYLCLSSLTSLSTSHRPSPTRFVIALKLSYIDIYMTASLVSPPPTPPAPSFPSAPLLSEKKSRE